MHTRAHKHTLSEMTWDRCPAALESEFLEDESRNPGMRCPEGPRHIPVSLELFFSTASPEGSAPHARSPSQMRDHTSFVFFSTGK